MEKMLEFPKLRTICWVEEQFQQDKDCALDLDFDIKNLIWAAEAWVCYEDDSGEDVSLVNVNKLLNYLYSYE